MRPPRGRIPRRLRADRAKPSQPSRAAGRAGSTDAFTSARTSSRAIPPRCRAARLSSSVVRSSRISCFSMSARDHLWADAGPGDLRLRLVVPVRGRDDLPGDPRSRAAREPRRGSSRGAEAFLMRLQPGEVLPPAQLDVSSQAGCSTGRWTPAPPGCPRAAQVLGALSFAGPDDDELAGNVYLRVELQHLVRLETSGAVSVSSSIPGSCPWPTWPRVPEWATRVIAVPYGACRRIWPTTRA